MYRNMYRNILFGIEGLRRVKPLMPRTAYREASGSDLIILVDLRETIYGLLNNRKKNLLVYNFWALLLGSLADAPISAVAIDGATYTMRAYNDPNADSAYVTFGVGTDPPDFSQIALSSRRTANEGSVISPATISEPDKRRIRLGRVTLGGVSEVGLYQSLYDTGASARTTMLGRTILSAPGSGYNVYYDVILKAPFLDNFLYYLYGILTNSRQNLVDRAGSSFTARTDVDVQASSLYLLIGTSNTPFSFGAYDLTNPVALASVGSLFLSVRSYVMYIASGAVRLPASMGVGEIGFAQNIYDIGGSSRGVLLGRIPLATPISRNAGDIFSTVIVFYAGT
jgi:hypothetical protein